MPTPARNGQTKVSPHGRKKLLEYRNVTVSQNNRIVLNDINLSINQGENVAILGPNGAGKSFLIKTIIREKYPHYAAHNSCIRILGRENWSVFELRSLLGIVSTDMSIIYTKDFSGWQAILSGFFNSIGLWSNHKVTPAMECKTREIMNQLGISELAQRKMNELSAGEVQRILIGRALAHNPKALVLDEPCASLDFRAAHELREKLRSVAQTGTSIIMVTHNLTDIIPEITRVILLKNGVIFKDGAKEEVLTLESLCHLFGISLELTRRDGYYHIL